jgi:hypothetical protein
MTRSVESAVLLTSSIECSSPEQKRHYGEYVRLIKKMMNRWVHCE